MKTISSITPVLAALALAVLPVRADIYSDPGGIGDFTGGTSALDMSSVTVNNDSANLYFTINLGGDPTAVSWANYYVGISENLFGGVGGDLNASGGWGKDIQMSTGGMDFFVGAYPYYSGGYNLLTWGGSAWTSAYYTTASEDSTSVTIPVPLSALGLSAGNTIQFDVWTSDSGSDTVLDALSDATARSWNSNPFDTGGNALSYTVTVPEPGACALLGLGGLLAIVRRRASAREF
jgi:hypothetical protein